MPAQGLGAYFDDPEMSTLESELLQQIALDPTGVTQIQMPEMAIQGTLPPEVAQNREGFEAGLREQLQIELQRQQNQQEAGLSQLEKYLQEYQERPQGIDVTALAALSDAWTPGGRMTEVAKLTRPESPDERKAKAFQMEQAIQKQRAQMAGDTARMLQGQLQSLAQQRNQERLERSAEMSNKRKEQLIQASLGQEGKSDRKQENLLRQQWRSDKTTQDSEIIANSFARLQGAGSDPSAAGDIALIYSFMKILDPGSVVRETEFSIAQNAGAFDERVQSAVKRVLQGQRLSPNIRKDFMDRARKIHEKQMERQEQVNQSYEQLAQLDGVDASKVVLRNKFTPLKTAEDKLDVKKNRIQELMEKQRGK